MLRTLLLVIAGLVAGFAVAFWLAPGPAAPPAAMERSGAPVATTARGVAADSGAAAARLAALENALAEEVDERVALEARVAELAQQLDALGAGPARSDGPANVSAVGPDPAQLRERLRRDPVARNDEAERRFAARLVAEGFAPDRAEWLMRRTEELRMQALQAQYDAQRGGRPVDAGAGEQALRTELGEADYERYLRAYGRPTTIPVRDVLASSPAERFGLMAGDEILAYAGKRVFDMRELNALTLEGTPGESVIVDVRRGGQSVQLVMPRGPLGITGGGFRGR